MDLLAKEAALVQDSNFHDFIDPYLNDGWFPNFLKEGYLTECKTFSNCEEDEISYLISKSDLKLEYLFDAWYEKFDSVIYFGKLNEFRNEAYKLLDSNLL